MFQSIVIKMVISFVIKQLEKFGEKIDFKKVKADAEERVRALIPGTWFDDEAVMVVDAVLDGCEKVLHDTDTVKKILKLLAAQDYTNAVLLLKTLLLGLWQDATQPHLKAVQKHLLLA